MSTDTRFQRAPQDVVDRLARVEERNKNMATREDVAEIKGLIALNKLDLDTAFERAVSTSESSTLKNMLKTWAIIAGLLLPILTGVIIALLTALLNASLIK